MPGANLLTYELAHMSIGGLARTAEITHRFWSQPVIRSLSGPMSAAFEAAALLTQRSIVAAQSKPDWRITETVVGDGVSPVELEIANALPFGDLIHFRKLNPPRREPKVLVVAPKSGHFATLLRDTVTRLLPEADVYVTDWRNARDVPVIEGSFDVEGYVAYLLRWFDLLGPDLHVVGVCQPAPLALIAAVEQERTGRAPLGSLVLMGGPVDPAAAPTEVTKFADSISIDALRRSSIHRVPHAYPGRGRLVYPGAVQLAAFMSMNLDRHSRAFQQQWLDLASGNHAQVDRHNAFYDEYLAVMDMTAEFYLTTVERIFQRREVAANSFVYAGRHVSLEELRGTPLLVVEGGRDDIAAPGQCAAALDLTTRLPKKLKLRHLEAEAGHYAIFSGSKWRSSVAPTILGFMNRFEPAKART
ncbi:polyhydroxyalkanoate depolymerase [bacterium]|nr:polyhydroxyalkanoate depolymerase [bacterium]